MNYRRLILASITGVGSGAATGVSATAITAKVASATELDCGIAYGAGPGFYFSGAGFVPHVTTVSCPASTSTYVYASTVLYKDESGSWVQVDPKPANGASYSDDGVTSTTAKGIFACGNSTTCPGTYKQIIVADVQPNVDDGWVVSPPYASGCTEWGVQGETCSRADYYQMPA